MFANANQPSDPSSGASATARESDRYELRLYVGGNNARSLAAIGNIKTILEAHVPGRYDLEVVDIFQNPSLRERDQILALPTLVKCAPEPARRIIGDLSDTEHVLTDLGLLDSAPSSPQ